MNSCPWQILLLMVVGCVLGLSPSLCRLFCSNTFHILRPTKAPGFVYAWLELISHRIFIARMLAHTPQQKVCSSNTSDSWLRLDVQRCLTVLLLLL